MNNRIAPLLRQVVSPLLAIALLGSLLNRLNAVERLDCRGIAKEGFFQIKEAIDPALLQIIGDWVTFQTHQT